MNIEIILLYFLIGCFWSLWLEHFTTKNLEAPYNEPWVQRERLIHIICWPITLVVFLHNFFTGLFK